MPRLTAHRITWIVILAVALVTRLAACAWWQSRVPPGQSFYFGDSDAYWQLGRAIAAGEPYQYLSPEAKVLRTPGYPLVLAGVFSVFGNDTTVMHARIASAVLGTLSVGVVGWWATLLFDARAGVIAGWIAAVYPGAVSISGLVLTEAPFCPFMLVHLALWGLAWRAASLRAAILFALAAGAAAGIATLVRPSWLLFAPFALAIALVFDKQRVRQITIGLAMAASFVLCMAPWWIRNAQVTGHFVATTLQVGASLYDGWNPAADGSSDMSFVPQFVAQQRADDQAAEAELADTFEYRLNRRMFDAAIDWARAHPGRAVQLVGLKFARVWNIWPNEASLRRWPVRLVMLGTYVPLLGCGLVGVWRYTRWGWPYVLAWLPAIYFTLLHVVFVAGIRYREPAMLALTILAAGVLAGRTRNEPRGRVATSHVSTSR